MSGYESLNKLVYSACAVQGNNSYDVSSCPWPWIAQESRAHLQLYWSHSPKLPSLPFPPFTTVRTTFLAHAPSLPSSLAYSSTCHPSTTDSFLTTFPSLQLYELSVHLNFPPYRIQFPIAIPTIYPPKSLFLSSFTSIPVMTCFAQKLPHGNYTVHCIWPFNQNNEGA